jgi:indole-3-glycerol phosphate synthase
VAEIKRLIPKLAAGCGRPRDERDAGQLAGLYQKGGAAGISLVTERRYFGGEPEKDIPAVLQATSLPLLVKDFILEGKEVDFYAGITERLEPSFTGRVTLLLHAHLLGENLPAMLEYVYSCGMHALIETRGEQDLHYLNTLGEKALMIGINNKNIDELEMGEDLVRITPEIVASFREVAGDAVIISQSAHRSAADIRCSIEAGADAVLVGTALMLSGDPAGTVSFLVRAGGS